MKPRQKNIPHASGRGWHSGKHLKELYVKETIFQHGSEGHSIDLEQLHKVRGL